LEVNFRELSCSSRLLLMPVRGGRRLAYGFAIGDPRRYEVSTDLVDVVQIPPADRQVLFTLSAEDKLPQLLRIFHVECGVFLVNLAENFADLLVVIFAVCHDGCAYPWFRKFDRLYGDVV